MMDPGGGEPQYVRESRRDMWPLDFSRDGSRLIYSELSPETNFDIWTMSLDLSDP